MIEIRFHEELYGAAAIDEAAKIYEPYASITVARGPSGVTVTVQEKEGGAEAALIAAELANYALGRTIEQSRSAAAQSAPRKEAA